MQYHTSYLSFLLHRQDFRKPNFTPKITTKGTKNTKNVSEKVKYMHFFSLNLEKFTPDRNFLHRHRLWCLWQIWGMLCNFSIKRGDENAHLLCPQLLQSQNHSPICSMGRCQPPTPKEGSSCCSSLLTRAFLQFFSGNRFYKNYFKMSANTQ